MLAQGQERVLLTCMSNVFNLSQTVIWEFSTFCFISIDRISETFEVDFFSIVIAINFQFISKVCEDLIIFPHRFHFLYHFIEDLGWMISWVKSWKGLKLHGATIHNTIFIDPWTDFHDRLNRSKIISLHFFRTCQKFANFIRTISQISPLKNVALVGKFLNDLELLLKCLIIISLFSILNKINAEKISKTRSNVFSWNNIIRWAISSPRRFRRICCWQSVNSSVFGKVDKHWSWFTCLNYKKFTSR